MHFLTSEAISFAFVEISAIFKKVFHLVFFKQELSLGWILLTTEDMAKFDACSLHRTIAARFKNSIPAHKVMRSLYIYTYIVNIFTAQDVNLHTNMDLVLLMSAYLKPLGKGIWAMGLNIECFPLATQVPEFLKLDPTAIGLRHVQEVNCLANHWDNNVTATARSPYAYFLLV